MAFTSLNLTTQQLLESTFISDMRLIINANTATLVSTTQNVVNTLEIDLVNKFIGVDNFLGQVKTNNVILGTSISFMDSTNTIASLTKTNGKSVFSLDNIVIQNGGSIDASSTGSSIVAKQFAVGLTKAQLATILNGASSGFFVGSSSVPVAASFSGSVGFSQAVTHGAQSTPITAALVTGGGSYSLDLPITATSKQYIYLSIKLPSGASPNASIPFYVFLYETLASNPVAGQTFTIVIQSVYLSDGVTEVNPSDWGYIYIVPGYDLTPGTRYPIVINGGVAPTGITTAASAITDLATNNRNHIQLFNSSIQVQTGTITKKFGASVSLTKYGNTAINSTSWARYIVTNSHNIQIKH